MLRSLLVATVFALVLVVGRPAQAEGTLFHFYGAEDCPPCMAFKRDHLAGVVEAGKAHGFDVRVNVIQSTRDVPTAGSFGDTDALLRRAAEGLSFVYPPIFFVTRGDTVVSVHRGDWQAALERAVSEAGTS